MSASYRLWGDEMEERRRKARGYSTSANCPEFRFTPANMPFYFFPSASVSLISLYI